MQFAYQKYIFAMERDRHAVFQEGIKADIVFQILFITFDIREKGYTNVV